MSLLPASNIEIQNNAINSFLILFSFIKKNSDSMGRLIKNIYILFIIFLKLATILQYLNNFYMEIICS